jgi:predicted molibdopterin-dependent oxidoreductase YjgC
MIRVEGELREASWDEAIVYVAERLKSIKSEHGPDAIAGFSSARCTNEENYLFQKFMRAVIGTNNVDHCARL